MTGHCEHCDPDHIDCRDEGEYGWIHTQPVAEVQYRATWVSGHCPMCAVRKQIAAAIAAAAPREDPLHRDAIREAAEDAYLTCWTIARGGK